MEEWWNKWDGICQPLFRIAPQKPGGTRSVELAERKEGGGYGLAHNISVDPKNLPFGSAFGNPIWGMGYGGFEMEYIHFSGRLWHSTMTLLIGVGGIGVQER